MADSEATSTASSATSMVDSTASTAVSSASTVSQASSAAQSVSSTASSSASSASSTASAVSNASSAASSTVSSTSASSPVHLTDQEIYDLQHPKTYMAKAGEDLVSICNRFGVSYGSVANINHFRNAVRPWTNRPYQPPMLLKLRV